MQLNGNTVGEYLSRKYTLTLIALIVVCYKLISTSDPTWAVALTGCVVGILGQYGYFNTKETAAITELKIKGLAEPKPPVESDSQP